MVDPTPLVQQWIQKAEEDWEAAQLLIKSPSQAATTCFHCQQCAEKLFKAALLARGGDVPKTHDLTVLSSRLSELDADWHWDVGVLEDLSTGAVASRYPGYTIDADDAAESIHMACELRSALLQRLNASLSVQQRL
jgi:HEPN domain-containing protein